MRVTRDNHTYTNIKKQHISYQDLNDDMKVEDFPAPVDAQQSDDEDDDMCGYMYVCMYVCMYVFVCVNNLTGLTNKQHDRT